MPSKGVRHRHTKRKTEKNTRKRNGYYAKPETKRVPQETLEPVYETKGSLAETASPKIMALSCRICGFTAKSPRGLAVHQGRLKHSGRLRHTTSK